jgi:hypothetical protein
MGDYTIALSDWSGEFINETAINTTTGIGDRKCYLCDSKCRWCRYNSTFCLQCRDTYYLMDLKT